MKLYGYVEGADSDSPSVLEGYGGCDAQFSAFDGFLLSALQT